MSEEIDGLRTTPEPVPPAMGAPVATGTAKPGMTAAERRSTRNIVEWVGIVAGALILAVIVKTFLFQAFYIPSLSMYPTLHKGDRVLVNKVSYDLHDIHRGDIVVFERPPGEPTSIKDLIKRVIGLPGDVIEGRDGIVYVNGTALEESYIDPGDRTENLPKQTVPAGELFVMGDNRNNSEDSRVFGPIPEKTVVGRAFVRVWPVTRLGLL
jgi:signal peptidase I